MLYCSYISLRIGGYSVQRKLNILIEKSSSHLVWLIAPVNGVIENLLSQFFITWQKITLPKWASVGQRSQRSADWTSKSSPAFLSTNKTHVSVALNRDALLYEYPSISMHFLKVEKNLLGQKEFHFGKSRVFQINLNAYGLCACTYENTFRNIKSSRWSLWLFIREKQLSLAQLENWENIKPARGPA